MNNIMLGMLVNLLESLDQIVKEDAKLMIGVLKDLCIKLGSERGEVWLKELKTFLRQKTCWIDAVKTYYVNGLIPLANMIQLAGFLPGQFNSYITKDRFPVTSTGLDEWDFKVFWFNESLSSEEAKGRIESEDSDNPWQAARIEHLLVYRLRIQREKVEYMIVALGSVGDVNGKHYVPILGGDFFGCYLGLNVWNHGWDAKVRFLAVRKVSRVPAT